MLRTGDALPPKRTLFEQYQQAGPIGEDSLGHPVVLERSVHIHPNLMHEAFSFEMFMENMVYNREVQRAYLARVEACLTFMIRKY